MYALYIGNKNYSSWSLRPWVLMKTLAIPFEQREQRFIDGGSYHAFRAFSPTGLVPLLVDREIRIWESLAIAEYLAEAHPEVWPRDKGARAWARSAASEMHAGFSALRNTCSMSVGIRVTLPDITPALRQNLDRIGELWTEGLTRFGGPFLAGAAFTAADAFYCPVAFRVQTYSLELPPAAADYAQRLLALPAMKEWYAAALAETFREDSHEDEIRASGTWTADYRATA
jgi:glutathione S-transferase